MSIQKHQILVSELFKKIPNFGYEFPEDCKDVVKYAWREPSALTPKLNPIYKFPDVTALEVLTILQKPERNNIWISGPTGSGKTSFARNLASLLNVQHYYEFNGDVHKTPSHAFGKWTARAGETIFRDGVVTKWLRTGGLLLINEYDTFSSEVVNALKPVLEDPRRITLVEHDDEVITGHPDCRVIVTTNTKGRGDDSGFYPNTNVQSIADLRRFHGFFEIDYLEAEAEVAMVVSMFPTVSKEVARKFVTVANKTRKSFDQSALGRVISTAEVINWVENYTAFTQVHAAASISFLTSYSLSDRQAVLDIIDVEFGKPADAVQYDVAAAQRAAEAVGA